MIGRIAVVALLFCATAAQAQVKVGVVMSQSGPVSSIGLPYMKGFAAYLAGVADVPGQTLQLITIDDASDPAAAARAARKLIEEERVDVLVGSAGTPASLALYGVAAEARVPVVITANALVAGERGAWEITVPQPMGLMLEADVAHMRKAGVKTVAFIGYGDAFGDQIYDALARHAEAAGIKIVANERFARADTSVTPQILKIMAARPDAVLTGGSGSPGALPHLALYERGYRGAVYSSHAIINTEFVRVGGRAVEGVTAPAGPVVVADQLDAGNPVRAAGLRFRELYAKANGEGAADSFAAYAYDSLVLLADGVRRATATGARPGTEAFRLALRDALVDMKDVVGTHAVYNFVPGERFGTDARARVMVRLEKGVWTLVP